MHPTLLIAPKRKAAFAAAPLILSACAPSEPDAVAQVQPAVSERDAVSSRANAVSNFYSVYNDGEYDRLDAVLAAGFRHGSVEGPNRFKTYMRERVHAYRYVHIEVHETVIDGDVGATQWTLHVTEPATGRRITLTGMSLLRFQNGKILEHSPHYDSATLRGE